MISYLPNNLLLEGPCENRTPNATGHICIIFYEVNRRKVSNSNWNGHKQSLVANNSRTRATKSSIIKRLSHLFSEHFGFIVGGSNINFYWNFRHIFA